MDSAVSLLSAKFQSSKRRSGIRKQCFQLDNQQKVNHENPFLD